MTDSAVYSIWNAPPDSWVLPFAVGAVEDLEAAIAALPSRSRRDTADVVAFRTPVTADVLILPADARVRP